MSKLIDELRTYAKGRKGELAKLINDAADTIERLSAQPDQRWIPVTEKLPKIGMEVLLSEPNAIMIAEYHGNLEPEGLWLVNGYHHYLATTRHCAWRPLPEPYKEEENDEQTD